MRRSVLGLVSVLLLVAAAAPAAANGGDPPVEPGEGRDHGAAVSAAAMSEPGAVADGASNGEGPGGNAPPGAGVAADRSARPDHVPGNPLYIALGDSWAYGQGASDPESTGYVALLYAALLSELDCLPANAEEAADGCKQLQLLSLGRPAGGGLPGVTTPLLASEQLPIVLPILEDRNGDANPRNDVEAVTVHVGGNDVSGPIQGACLGGFDAGCIATWIAEMAAYETDLRDVVSQLRAAAGDDTPIVLGTYDNPVPTCFLFGLFGPAAVTLGAFVLEGTPEILGSLDGIHTIVRRIATEFDADVAEVFGTLAPADFVGGADCLHIVDSGHEKVANVFVGLLGT